MFDDPFHLSIQDREVEGEARWQTLGTASALVLLVAQTVDDGGNIRIISARKATRHGASGVSMRKEATKTRSNQPSTQALTAKQKRELAHLTAVGNDHIDTSDIPELPLAAWNHAVRGRFYRPVKRAVSMRLDADVIAWLKKRGKGYQTRANRILRDRMLDESKRA